MNRNPAMGGRAPTDPMRLRSALKVAIAATVSALICIVLHLESGYLAPLIASLALILFPGRVVGIGAAAFLGSFVAGGVAVVIIGATLSAPLLLFVCTLAWLLLWMAFLTPFPLAHLMGGILIGMLLLTVAVQSAATVGAVFIDYLQQEFVGLLVAAILDRALWPTTVEQQFRRTLATLCADFARTATALRAVPAPLPTPGDPSTDILNRIVALSGLAARLPATRGLEHQRVVVRSRMAWDRLDLFAAALRGSIWPDQDCTALADAILAGFAAHWRGLSDAALAERPAPMLDAATREAARKLGKAIQSPAPTGTAAETSGALGAEEFVQLVELSAANHDAIATLYNRCLAAKGRPEAGRAMPVAVPPRLRWPEASAWRQSARIVLIIMILTFGLVYLQLPGSTLVAFYGISFGLTANVGQLYFKSGSGFLGAVSGLLYGALGIIVVLQTPTLPVLMATFFLGVLMFAYVAYGDEIFAFAGLQATLIVPYVLVVFEGPQWTLDNGLTRAVALCVAAAAAVFVQYLFWPVRVFDQLRARIADTLERSGETLALTTAGGPDQRTAFLPAADRLAAAVSSGEALLKDAQYAAGSADPRSRTYLTITRQLEDILANLFFLQRVVGKYGAYPAVAAFLAVNAPLLAAIGAAFRSLAGAFRDPAVSLAAAPLPLPPPVPNDPVDHAASGAVALSRPPRRQLALVRQTLENIVRSVNIITAAARAAPSASQ